MLSCIRGLLLLPMVLVSQHLTAREWNVREGNYTLQGTLVAFDDQQVVIKLDDAKKLHGNELVAIQRVDLSTADNALLANNETGETSGGVQTAQT